MNITMDLFHIVEHAHSLARILAAASSVIAERLRVDDCSVFLLEEHGNLVRSPADGSDSSKRSERADKDAESIALMALGVDSLSVVPTAIPELKQALAGAPLEPMRRAMEGILALSDARSIAAALREARFA